MRRGAGPNEVIFRAGDAITPYGGQRVTQAVIDRRYGDYTARYGIKVSSRVFENGACKRGVGTLANHADGDRANAEFVNDRGVSKLYATKDIRNGQEILVNYGDEYLMDEQGVVSRTSRARGPARVLRRGARR
jgi:hypothetical protein